MGKRVLEVEKKTIITSECWTYYKFAVMQTMDWFDMWLASHMNICMQNDDVDFGDCIKYPLSYYGEILEMKDPGILLISKEKMLQFLIEQIDNGYYIILDLNFSRLYDVEDDELRMHETLIYGYDTDCREFLVPLLSKGKFRETRVTFEAVGKAYGDVYDYYSTNVEQLFARRKWFAPITLIKPKPSYKNINVYYDFIEKVKRNLQADIYTICRGANGSQENETCVVYRGLSVMQHLSELLRQDASCSPEEVMKNYRRRHIGCLKLYEHQNMMCRSMQWYLDTIDNDCVKLQRLVDEYRVCKDKVRLAVPLIQKYSYTKDPQLLLHIAGILEEVLKMEPAILETFMNDAPEEYIRKRLVDKWLGK